MDLNDLNKVWEVKPLKKPREDEAREILEKVARQVQPIMRKRKWKVKILYEFCPSNPALLGLNVNGGAEVKLRLRRQNNEWDFFPYEQILDTMLHELCHNEFGPHNSDFYNLLEEIRKECEELMAKGITGSGGGFDLQGRRLGGFSRQPPLSSLRQKALSAAENRVQRATLLPSGPKRLGGDSSMRAALSPIQAAAMAAERRLHDDLWCASHSQVKEVGQTSGEALPVPSRSVSNSHGEALPSRSVSNSHGEALPSRLVSNSHGEALPSRLVSNSHGEGETEEKASWQCGSCTLLNQALVVTCEACGTKRMEEEKAAKTKMWSCKFCTLQNSVAKERCEACGEWRYSYGPPTTSRMLGT